MIRTVAFLFLFLSSAVFVSASSFAGDWIGIAGEGKDSIPLKCHLEEKANGLQGIISLPAQGVFEERITEIEDQPPKLTLRIKKEAASIELKGERTDETLKGKIRINDSEFDFSMFSVFPVKPEKYFGVFEFKNGKHVYIRTWDELGHNQLTYFTDDGKTGALNAIAEDSFTSGPGLWIPLPVVTRVKFARNAKGEIVSLRWNETEEQIARKVFLKEEEVTFSNQDLALSGSFVVPSGKGPFPAVVLVHGSGPVTRDFFGPLAYLFAQHGIAVLSYDKRGNGKSQGDWLDADFSDLANDALAAVAFLKNRSEVDAHRIGLWGISQGGWIVPIAAAQSKDISFAILLSTPSGTPLEQEVQSTQEEMKVQGATEEQIKAAVASLRSQIDSLRGEDTKKALEEQVAKLQKEGSYELLHSNGAENPKFLLFYRRIMDFDPAPYLKKLGCPVLVLYGESDRGVPVSENLEKLKAYLQEAGNKSGTVRIFPKGDHAMMLAETGSRQEFFHLNRFVPGFFETMVDWIRKQTRL